MRHAGGAEQDLPGFDIGGFFFPLGRSIDQMLDTSQLQRHLVGWVDVKVPTLLAPAAEERNRLGVLPQNPAGLAFGFDLFDDAGEIDGDELFHGLTIALCKL